MTEKGIAKFVKVSFVDGKRLRVVLKYGGRSGLFGVGSGFNIFGFYL